jgi:predicted nucleic acid-binding protein
MGIHMTRKRIYLETSVIGYLTARPSNNIENAARQLSSAKMWDSTDEFEFLISPIVIAEWERGDAQLVIKRSPLIAPLPILEATPIAFDLAAQLIKLQALPAKASDDALHIAIAAVHGINAIASWNFKHISGAWARRKIETALTQLGFNPPIIASPEALTEIKK